MIQPETIATISINVWLKLIVPNMGASRRRNSRKNLPMEYPMRYIKKISPSFNLSAYFLPIQRRNAIFMRFQMDSYRNNGWKVE